VVRATHAARSSERHNDGARDVPPRQERCGDPDEELGSTQPPKWPQEAGRLCTRGELVKTCGHDRHAPSRAALGAKNATRCAEASIQTLSFVVNNTSRPGRRPDTQRCRSGPSPSPQALDRDVGIEYGAERRLRRGLLIPADECTQQAAGLIARFKTISRQPCVVESRIPTERGFRERAPRRIEGLVFDRVVIEALHALATR
jgi:hypothetical protein